MYKTAPIVDPKQVAMDSLRARLKSLDLRIARMRELHAESTDPLAHRLIEHSMVERAEVMAKMAGN
jgi:hypothetical protein